MTIDKIQINCAEIIFINDQMIQVNYKDGHYCELEDIIELNNVIEDFSQGRPIYAIVDNNNKFSTYSKEAQEYLAKKAPIVQRGIMRCSAVIVDNLPSRIITRFFMNFYKPAFPIQIFSKYDDALKWVHDLIEKEKVINNR